MVPSPLLWLLLALTTMTLTPQGTASSLLVTDVTSGRIVLCQHISAGDHLSLSFTNSIYGGEVREDYEITDQGRLRRTRMTTERAAAADYYAYTVNVIPEGDRYRIDVPPVELTVLVVRVDQIGQHSLTIGAHQTDLLALTGDRHQVRIAVEALSWWDRLRTRGC